MTLGVQSRPAPRPLDLRLYLVTDTVMTAPHGLISTIRAAVAGGATVVQLRDPDASDDEFVALGRMVQVCLRDSGVPLIINDRVHLVGEIGADGAHVGQDDLDPLAAREQLGGSAYLGLSCTTAEEVRAAAALPPGTVDYLGLGPVRATATKPDHAAPLGPDKVCSLADLAAAAALPSVAIGGIDIAVAGRLRGSALGGIAVVSAVCAAPDPETASRELRSLWDAHPVPS
ncbi:thiamine phosphate synthase [Ornithinimicrobium pratense]|uniref:Thiamine-phosphate synthase n=1 Tax=Ornithinimicrobium pratense TaxID=2593973 RepID=A0A5J6V4X7_9MICO|nr:thiamine phosphate synthase [Ornithinimicrobium pratense]QFG68354.1 thiamine phosphate synthase [Ornithinimicrobium pratense]